MGGRHQSHGRGPGRTIGWALGFLLLTPLAGAAALAQRTEQPPTYSSSGNWSSLDRAPSGNSEEPALIGDAGALGAHLSRSQASLVEQSTPWTPPHHLECESCGASGSDLPRDARDGVFQKLLFDLTYLPRERGLGLGMVDAETRLVLAVPCPTRQWPMLIIPGFAVHFLDAPPTADLPQRVYDSYVMFRWLPKINDRLMFDAAVTPGVYRDFEQATDDGWRTTAHGAAVLTWTPTLKLVGGAMYLDRRDWNVLPLGGLIWTPTPDAQFDLLFPKPRAAWRIYTSEGLDEMEDWLYVAGEFGDWIWAIQRTNGVRDRVAYRDIRVLLGVEHKVIGGLSNRLEIGYVFGRKVTSYDAGAPDFEPPGTLLLRAECSY